MIKNLENETKIDSSQIRILPQSLDAEQKLLSAILTNNKAYEKVSEFLKPIHFANDAHAEIFAACSKLIERGQLADPITLKDYFIQNKKLEEIGGFEYIMNVTSASVTIINAEDYGRIVFDRYIRREMIALGSDIVNDAFVDNLESSAENQIETAEKRLYELSDSKDSSKGLIDFSKALNVSLQLTKEALQREGGLVGVSTGFIDLDKKLGGLHDSDLLILAGRPGMGKTALAQTLLIMLQKVLQKNPKTKAQKQNLLLFSRLKCHQTS
jgi:replicative DNA helicase